MRNTQPHNSAGRNKAVRFVRAYDIAQRIATAINPFKPAGTLTRWKRGKHRPFGHISIRP